MNMYRVVYYMSVLALIVNALAMIGTLLGWFYFVESKYLFWINLVLLSIFNRLKKKEKGMLKNRLKELRARDGLNQTDLAKLAGVSRQTISLLERDEYTPSIIIALKISQIFNETVESVFRLEEDE